MKQQVNKTLIGGFVVGALALLTAGVMVFGSGKFFEKRSPFVLYFQESVKGLNVGSPVVFKGVPIGSVTDIMLVADQETLTLDIPVSIELEPDKIRVKGESDATPGQNMTGLIEKGLRGQLQSQSMVTGQLMIELDFHPDTPATLMGAEDRVREIPTVPSTLATLFQTIKSLKLEELTKNLSDAVAGFDRLVNAPEVKGSLEALHATIRDAQKLIRHTDGRIDPLVDGIEAAVADSRKLIGEADRQVGELAATANELLRNVNGKIDPLAANANRTFDDARMLLGNVDARVAPLADSMRETAAAATEAFEHAEKTLKAVEGTVGRDSRVMVQVTRTLKELSGASRAIRVWAEYLERHPEALVRGKNSN